ncbi:MAG: KpsF/GutQ family sugar-phosphate isomerase [Candidatus Zixiibacteriota bacterium]
MSLVKYAQEVIRHEVSALAAMADRLDENFDRVIEAILACKGRVIVSGMGKSGLVGKKIVATFNSTGISSFFLHPAEAMHGDLGLIRSEDILMFISKSGQLEELDAIIGVARRLDIRIIGLCGTINSPLCQRADLVLDCSVETEACPNNLVPTSSSTAALVMGDALAVALLKARNFSSTDFAVFHPGGFIGRRLLKKVVELRHTGDEIPLVKPETTVSEMILEMTSKRLGCVLMKDDNSKPSGVFTDGDLRRLMEKNRDPFKLTADRVMIKNFKCISDEALLDTALAVMERHAITQLPTIDADGRLTGIIHLHDILKSKLV